MTYQPSRRPWRIVVAPQALKGSLDAQAVARAIAAGVTVVLPDADLVSIPVADGGEGTTRVLVEETGGSLHYVSVTGPLGDPIEAAFGILGRTQTGRGRVAVIEMASASGLPLLPPSRRDPRHASTRGTGELMRAALDASCDELIIGIGGSATNDGGAGMAQALGARFLDAGGHELAPGGAALADLDRIDTSGLDPRLRHVRVRVACDVRNPLTGPEGASAIYGPQKGATADMVTELDAALARFAAVVQRDLGVDVATIPGGGAAGGLGAGLVAFADAELLSGARLVLDVLDFAQRIAGAHLLFTAEGCLDAQTEYGKITSAVADMAHAAGARVVALAGQLAIDDAGLQRLGIDAALAIADGPLALDESMARAAELLAAASARALRLILVGSSFPRE